MATIKIHNGAAAGRSYELLTGQTLLGRDQFCDIVLPTQSISRQHARITREGDAYFLEDLSSLNGTFVNGERIGGRRRLKDQDHIQLYDLLLTFHLGAPGRGGEFELPSQAILADEAQRRAKSGAQTKIIGALDGTADPALDVATRARLQAVLALTRKLGHSLVVDEFLNNILDSLFEIFSQADRGYILLAEKESSHLAVAAMKQLTTEDDGSSTMGPINRAVAERVMATGEAILSHSAEGGESILAGAAQSAMSAPLIGPSRKPLGVIHVEGSKADRQFAQEDLEVLVSVAMVAGQAIEHARVHEASMRHDRRERELTTAREVQRHFLPQSRPDAAGYRFFDYYRAADDVGGDYFGYLPLPNDKLAIAVGDVSGKGVSAALLMARLCSEVRYCLATSRSPVEAVGQLNEGLSDPTLAVDDRFVTFLLCVLDPRDHSLVVVNAGHMPPLARRKASGVVEQLGVDEAGPPLGFDRQKAYVELKTRLDPGDTIVMYTDGISEAVSRDDNVFGIKRVREVVAAGPSDVERLGKWLLEDLENFMRGAAQSDDICLLCFGRMA